MSEELKAVETDFVNKVSATVIEQLLDNLVYDQVLNDGEQEAITEEHDTRAKRARVLIKTVGKKGDEASWKMINHLKKRDPTLFKELGLPDQSPQAASEKELQWSTTLVPCKRTFWNSKKNDDKIYPVTEESIKSRVALLITNIKFKEAYLNRDGAEADERNMEKLLEAFRYEVVKYTNLTGKEIEEAVVKFSTHPKLKNTDSVFVVVMSHGKLGSVLGVNWNTTEMGHQEDVFAIDNIFKHLSSANCEALLGKPKIIIVQACRGECGDRGNVVVNEEKDFLAFFSCTPDTMSYRHVVDGGFLIRYIVDALNTFACEEDIEELFRMVMRRFEKLILLKRKQTPTKDRCTLSRRFYLFPGI